MITDLDLGWLAGILEGEGCFTYSHHGRTRISINSVDEDVIRRVASLFEKITESVCNVVEREMKRSDRQNQFNVEVYGPNAKAVMKLIVKHMSWRRRQRIYQTLNGYKPKDDKTLEVVGLKVTRSAA